MEEEIKPVEVEPVAEPEAPVEATVTEPVQ